MESGKTGKYLKYAIGEIFLVVIGILIALSINTWNENRKESEFEKEILEQIKTNLEKDRAALVAFATNGNRAIASANKILALPQGSEHDSLKYWLGDFMQFDRFQPLTSSYEVLKSKGLDLISNKELRFQLGSYYDDRSAFINKAITDLEWAFINEWLPITRKYVVDFKFKNYMELSDYDPFTSPSEVRNSLIMNRNNWAGSVTYINDGIELIDSVISLIKTELE